MRPTRQAVAAFIALALLQALASAKTFGLLEGSMMGQHFAALTLLAVPGALALLGGSLYRRYAMPNSSQWAALVLLALPGWLSFPLTPPYVRAFPGLHEPPWGTPFLLTISAPLWLALLAELRIVHVEVPRAVAGAAIAGVGAVCLIVPTDTYAVSLNQIPVLVLEILLLLATLYSWAYAREQLSSLQVTVAAGSSLLIQAASSICFSLLIERPQWQPFVWRSVALPWLLEIVPFVVCAVLWFWLLQRISLGAFCMNTLAQWTATVILTFVLFGFLSWRVDLALMIAGAAMTVALRARISDEQPLALGLHRQ